MKRKGKAKSQLNLQLMYDHASDVLSISRGHPVFADYSKLDDDIVMQLDPRTREIVGFAIIDFLARFVNKETPSSLPLTAKFERLAKKQKVKTAKKSTRAKRAD